MSEVSEIFDYFDAVFEVKPTKSSCPPNKYPPYYILLPKMVRDSLGITLDTNLCVAIKILEKKKAKK